MPVSTPAAPSLARWPLAAAVALLGSWVLWKAELGINWPLWLGAAAVALLLTVRRRTGRIGAASVAAACWSVIIAGGVAITTSGGWHALMLMGSLLFFAIAIAAAGEPSIDALQPRLAISAPFVAIASVFAGLLAEIADRAGVQRSARRDAIVRSVVITLPVVVVLVLLLADADPLFAALRGWLEDLVPLDDPARIIFFGLLLALSVGVMGSVARGAPERPALGTFRGVEVGGLESRVLTIAMAVVMWLFVVSASLSLLHNPVARAGSGITYAEYAHRGFAELNIAATLVIGAILATRRTWPRSDAVLWRAAAAALAGVGGMLVIAFLRLVRYEQAYGFTYERMQAQGYMLVLACALALLGLEVARRAPSGRFAYHTATATLVIAMAAVYYNTDAWIVRRNVALYQARGVIDLDYLTRRLSDDAEPALIASIPLLHAPERTTLDSLMRKEASDRRHATRAWFEWNLRQRQRDQALDALSR